MYISSFSSHTAQWHINQLQFGKQNLIVGKNAGGKSSILRELYYFLREVMSHKNISLDGNWAICFKYLTNKEIRYELEVSKNRFQNEKFYLNEENIPFNLINHSFIPSGSSQGINHLEMLNSIQRHIRLGLKTALFANTSPTTNCLRLWEISKEESLNINIIAQKFSKIQLQSVVKSMNHIGYHIEKCYFEKTTQKVFILEKGEDDLLAIEKMSQGMFRAFALLMYLEYLIERKEISLLLIDDFCEGLDYERATKLGKYVFDLCQKQDIQLIATTNDSFLMDAIDISCWNVLQRDGKEITTINERSHPALFEKFKMRGMSNFDFFASDFIPRQLQKEKV